MRIRRYSCVCEIGLGLILLPAGWGQQTTAPPPDRAPAPAPTAWSAGPIDFSGLVDVYYSKNFNNPASLLLSSSDTAAMGL